jgi:hypothetical protein
VLRVVQRELFLLANPLTEASRSAQPDGAEVSISVWDEFRKDKYLRRIHNVSNAEMEMLSQVAGVILREFVRLAT